MLINEIWIWGRAQHYQCVYKISKHFTIFNKRYSTTHFLIIHMSCNLQDVLGVLCLTFLQNLK